MLIPVSTASASALPPPGWNIAKRRELMETALPHNQVFENLEVGLNFPAIGKPNHAQLILLELEDITE
jgi:hypothetical protein